MKACRTCAQVKALTLFHKDSKSPDGRRSECVSCSQARKQEYYQKNRELLLAKQRRYSESNGQRLESYRQAYQLRMRDHLCKSAAARKGKAWNPRPRSEQEWAAYRAEMRLRLEARRRFQASARRRGVRQATPKWADPNATFEVFVMARQVSVAMGIPWHVDHIVPLKSPLVCGLHWHGNLQLLPATVNLLKSNRTWPDAP